MVNTDNKCNISDVVTLTSYILKNEWSDKSFYEEFYQDSLQLYNTEGTAIKVYPGIVYQGVGTDGSISYFLAKNYQGDSSALYPIQINKNNLSNELIRWLNNAVLNIKEDLPRNI